MVGKLYIVQLKGAQDPEDKAYRRAVRASNVHQTLRFLARPLSSVTQMGHFQPSMTSRP
jgi:hypothetical protein